jgi:type IV pilus assembly protein PilF
LRRVALLLAPLLLALLAGCQTTTTTTTSATPPEARPVMRNPNDGGDPDRRAQVRLELAAAYLGRGQPQTALDEVRQAIAAKPDQPAAYAMLGLIQSALGDVREAEAAFQRALRLAPNDADTMHNYAWFLCQQRRFADADVQFRAAVSQPQYREPSRTWLAQGICQARDSRWDDAERSLNRAFELDPANPTTAFSLTEVLYRRGAYERARFYIQRVNAVPDYSNAQTLWLAARIERRMGNVGSLQTFGRQLLERFPQSAEAALYQQGRFDD